MLKYVTAIWQICLCLNIYGQSISGPETVKKYSISQKQLSVINTFQLAHFINRDNLDKDSVRLIVCRITGMTFLLPYNEGFSDKISVAVIPVNNGRIRDTINLLNSLEGKIKIQLLIELSIWFLRQQNTYKTELNSAGIYIENASMFGTAVSLRNWQTEWYLNAISLIHQKLCKSGDAAFTNINEYVHELVEHIRNGFNSSAGFVFELKIGDSQIAVAHAVLLDLILNEVITNASTMLSQYKHQGRVSISSAHSSATDNYLVTVADNGVGLLANYELSKKAFFGIPQMLGSSKQLHAIFNMHIKVAFKSADAIKFMQPSAKCI